MIFLIIRKPYLDYHCTCILLCCCIFLSIYNRNMKRLLLRSQTLCNTSTVYVSLNMPLDATTTMEQLLCMRNYTTSTTWSWVNYRIITLHSILMHTNSYLQEDILWDLKCALSFKQMSCASDSSLKGIKTIGRFDGGVVLTWASRYFLQRLCSI
jgi:hypothetical protein